MQSAFCGQSVAARRPVAAFAPRRSALLVENAHKKGAGSTKNGRDSRAQRLGVKVYGGQPVKAGGIIVRQVGSTWHDGENTQLGKDYTLFSTVEGIVIFGEKNGRSVVDVYPHDHEKAVAMVARTHTMKAKEGTISRKERRKTLYQPRGKANQPLGVATVAAAARP